MAREWIKENKEGTIYTLNCDSFTIVVHRLLGLKDMWFVTSHQLHLRDHDLTGITDIEEAKEKASEYVLSVLEKVAADAQKYLSK